MNYAAGIISADHTTERDGNDMVHFLQDTIALWSGKRSGHMITYAYAEPHFEGDPAGGAVFWRDNVTKNPFYYIYSEEKSAINQFSSAVHAILPPKRFFVEGGPGEAVDPKTIDFLAAADDPQGYHAIDVNPVFAEGAALTVDRLNPSLRGRTSFDVKDFIHDKILLDYPQNATFLMWGGLICNFATNGLSTFSKLVQNFEHIRDNVPLDYLVVTQDSNKDETSILKAYDKKYVGRFVLSVLHRMKRDLAPIGDFDPESFRPVVEWDAKDYPLKVSAVATRDMQFMFGTQTFKVYKGDEVRLSNSYKLPLDFFIGAAEKAGLASRTHYTPNGRQALHVLQRT